MLSTLVEAVDRRLASLLVGRARTRSPFLRLIPGSWIQPLFTPAAARLRRSLTFGALALCAATGAVILWLTLR